MKELKNVSISAGTLRTEDLIGTFIGLLDEIRPRVAARIRKEYGDIIDNPSDPDAVWFLHEVLFEELDKLAPEGCYFGAHPGDGSDFGFWSYEFDEEDDGDED